MEIIKAYKTKDGKKFLDIREAERHQIDLLGLELEKIPTFKAFTTTKDKHNMLLALMGTYKNAKAFYSILHEFFKKEPITYEKIQEIINQAILENLSNITPDMYDIQDTAKQATNRIYEIITQK